MGSSSSSLGKVTDECDLKRWQHRELMNRDTLLMQKEHASQCTSKGLPWLPFSGQRGRALGVPRVSNTRSKSPGDHSMFDAPSPNSPRTAGEGAFGGSSSSGDDGPEETRSVKTRSHVTR